MMFNQEHAIGLLKKMRGFYGKKFIDQWSDVSVEEIAEVMVECLQGLSAEDLKRGYARMMQSTFCPTIPEFRAWCLQGAGWLTEYEAWAQALAYEKSNRSISISIFVEQALRMFRHSFDELNPKSETQSKAFRDMYMRIISRARDLGTQQTFTEPSFQHKHKALRNQNGISQNGADQRSATEQAMPHKAVPCPPELMAQLKAIHKPMRRSSTTTGQLTSHSNSTLSGHGGSTHHP